MSNDRTAMKLATHKWAAAQAERQQIAHWLKAQSIKVEALAGETAAVAVEELADAIRRGEHVSAPAASPPAPSAVPDGMLTASRTLVRRDYRSPDGHRSYQAVFHDAADNTVDRHRVFAPYWNSGEREPGLLEQAGIEDGDEFELIVRKTGKRPLGERYFILQRDHHYGPETDAQMAFREKKGRIWNYRTDKPLPGEKP